MLLHGIFSVSTAKKHQKVKHTRFSKRDIFRSKLHRNYSEKRLALSGFEKNCYISFNRWFYI